MQEVSARTTSGGEGAVVSGFGEVVSTLKKRALMPWCFPKNVSAIRELVVLERFLWQKQRKMPGHKCFKKGCNFLWQEEGVLGEFRSEQNKAY